MKQKLIKLILIIFTLSSLFSFYTPKSVVAASASGNSCVSMSVNAVIGLSCTPNPVNMGTITGTGQSALTNNYTNCTVITNNSSGYKLDWKATTAPLTNANSDTIAAYGPASTGVPETWTVDTAASEWGGHLGSASTSVDTGVWGGADTYAGGKWLNIGTSDFQIASKGTETTISGDSEFIYFGAEIGASKFQQTGTYSDTVTITATTLDEPATPLTGIGDITGTPGVDQLLTAGSLTPNCATVSYQWQSADTSGGTYSDIIGATASTYTPVLADQGKFLKVKATATGLYTGTVTSNPSTIVDPPTITFGTQSWMKYNLDVGTRIDGATAQTNNSIPEKWCYNNDPNNCTLYGGLYQWNEVMQYVTTEGVQGLCPTGFHLPTDTEYKTLEKYLGMTQLQADATGWRGTTEGDQLKGPALCQGRTPCATSGFNGLLGGSNYGGSWYDLGSNGYFWSSSQYDASSAWKRNLNLTNAQVGRYGNDKTYGFSVRCLKN